MWWILLSPIVFIIIYFIIKGFLIHNQIEKIRLSINDAIIKVQKLIIVERSNLILNLANRVNTNSIQNSDDMIEKECNSYKNNIERYQNIITEYTNLYKKLIDLYLVILLNFNKINIKVYLDEKDIELLETDCYTRIINNSF